LWIWLIPPNMVLYLAFWPQKKCSNLCNESWSVLNSSMMIGNFFFFEILRSCKEYSEDTVIWWYNESIEYCVGGRVQRAMGQSRDVLGQILSGILSMYNKKFRKVLIVLAQKNTVGLNHLAIKNCSIFWIQLLTLFFTGWGSRKSEVPNHIWCYQPNAEPVGPVIWWSFDLARLNQKADDRQTTHTGSCRIYDGLTLMLQVNSKVWILS
jgi:hypothetical protein